MDTPPRIRPIDVLLFDEINALDVSGPAQAFDVARFHGRRMYDLRYVSLDGGPVRSSCGLTLGAEGAIAKNGAGRDLLVPGGSGVGALLTNEHVLAAIRARLESDGDGRVISVCSGSLVLAAAGVLDGQTATTHWSREPDTRRFPRIEWNLDRIAVSSERVFTSAGVTSGIDLALAIIRRDGGHQAALQVARELVVQLRRTGGQSQYAMHLAGQIASEDAFPSLIETVISEPGRRWTLDDMAAEAADEPAHAHASLPGPSRDLSRSLRRADPGRPCPQPSGSGAATQADRSRGRVRRPPAHAPRLPAPLRREHRGIRGDIRE